jgi:hypothetical protein
LKGEEANDLLMPKIFPGLFFIFGFLASFTAHAEDTTGIPNALVGGAPPSAPAFHYQPATDPFQACQQACACNCPGGVVIPAVPALSEGAPAGGSSPHGHGTHGHGYAPLPDEPLNYPVPFVERPQILPEHFTQPELAVSFLNDSSNPDQTIRERLSLGFQNNFADRWQAGALVNVSIDPVVRLGSIYTNAQYGINPFMNARLDLGARRSLCNGGDAAFSGGVGLPIKYALNPHFALVSGRTFTYALNDDLITWDVKSCQSVAAVGVPLGVLASFAENFDIGLRTGYRRLVGADTGTNFIPLSLDLAITVAKQADVGLSFELPNPLDTPTDPAKLETYAFERRFMIFAQTRL